jgi:hypothetical protein
MKTLRERVISNIIRSNTTSQLKSSIRYAELAGMLEDETIQEWIHFRKLLVFDDLAPY